MKQNIKPFDIFWAKLNENNDNSIQGGIRPVIVLSNAKSNLHSPIVNIIPLTRNIEVKGNTKRFPQHIFIPFGIRGSIALSEQLTCINKRQLLGSCVGNLSDPGIRKELANTVLKQLGIFDVVTNWKKEPLLCGSLFFALKNTAILNNILIYYQKLISYKVYIW